MAKIGTSNVNVQEIGNVLNAAGGSVNPNQPLTFFTAAAKINKWARNKPQRSSNTAQLSDYERAMGNFGLDVSTLIGSVTPQNLLNRAASGEDFYPYLLPTGGTNWPYRLSDFLGYDTTSTPPYEVEANTEVKTQQYPVYARYGVYECASRGFALRELASLDGMHLAILYSDGTNDYLINLAEESNEEITTSLRFDHAGTYQAMAVFTNYQDGYGIIQDPGPQTFVPVPESYRSISVVTVVVYAEATISWGGTLYYEPNGQYIYGFNMPRAEITYPNGATPLFEYALGLYVTIDSDFGEFHMEWYYTEQTIVGGANNAAGTVYVDNFPTSVYLSDIMGIQFDPNITVYYIALRPIVNKVSGDGYLDVTNYEEQVIYENYG